ncbi:MAG: hypothetical protein AAF125_10995 [Chloroflexota bacterium]
MSTPDYPGFVRIAALLIDHGITDYAANILAVVLAQTDVPPTTYDHAWELFDDLECSICPRVIWDARDYAERTSPAQLLSDLGAWQADDLPQLSSG